MIRQAGAIPWRWGPDGLQVLLITSSSRKRWQIPKGHIEPFQTPRECAAVEAWEEAGIKGNISLDPVGHWEYSKRGFAFGVEVFAMEVTQVLDRWPECLERGRCWFAPEDAAVIIEDHVLSMIVGRLAENLDPRALAHE